MSENDKHTQEKNYNNGVRHRTLQFAAE